MGTHGKREAGPIFCILWNLRHSFLEDTVSNFVLPLKRLLHSDSFARMEGFMVCMSKKNDKNEIQIDTILPCHANHFLSTIQMSPFDLHLRWIPSKRLLVVGQHWLWQRTGGWAVIHGALEIDGTGPKFGSEMIFYR